MMTSPLSGLERARPFIVLILLLALVACSSDDAADAAQVPSPTATAVEQPTPTPLPTATPEPTPTPEPDLSELYEQIDQIIQNTVELRGLELREELDINVVTQDEMYELLSDELFAPIEDAELHWMLRLRSDRAFDLDAWIESQQMHLIEGAYVPDTGEIFVIKGGNRPRLSVMEEVVLAHEIVHALQYQNFDLTDRYDWDDFDGVLALRAIIEGDATFTEDLYARTYFRGYDYREYRRKSQAYSNWDVESDHQSVDTPHLSASLLFTYMVGTAFVEQLYDGSFEHVDDYLEHPPISATLIRYNDLYPDDFWVHLYELPFPEVEAEVPEGWQLTRIGTLSFFEISWMLLLNTEGLDSVSDLIDNLGWSDFAKYRSGDDLLVVAGSTWITEAGAAEYEQALRRTMEGYEQHEGFWFGDDRYHAIARHGIEVTLISATNLEALRVAAGLH